MDETQAAILSAALLISMMANLVLWRLSHRQVHGHECPLCVNALATKHREAAERQAQADENAEGHRRQADLQHEVMHKGFGFKPADPDRYDCRAGWCERNTHKRRVGP